MRESACAFAAQVEQSETDRAKRFLCLQHQVEQDKLTYQELLEKRGRICDPHIVNQLTGLRKEIEFKESQLKALYPVESLPVPELNIETEPVPIDPQASEAEGVSPPWDVLPALHILKEFDDEIQVYIAKSEAIEIDEDESL